MYGWACECKFISVLALLVTNNHVGRGFDPHQEHFFLRH